MLARWEDPASVESLRNRFVTGDWEAGAERAAARPGEEGGGRSDDGEVYGDFEDLETGEDGCPLCCLSSRLSAHRSCHQIALTAT